MDLLRYISLLMVFFFDTIESGGHGGSHDHIKLYVPEFHHHKHHTKYITIHHHEKKPKEETHHHIPHIPHQTPHHHFGYHHTGKEHKIKVTTTTKHKEHHGHHHHQGHHHDDSSGYTPALSHDDSYTSSVPAIPHIPSVSAPHIPSYPQIHGVTQTVKQLNVYDSLPGAVQGGGGGKGKGYEVTEENEDEEDTFTAVNDIQNSYPSTYEFLKSSAPNPFGSIGGQNHQLLNTHNSFAPSSHVLGDSNSFLGSGLHNSYGVIGGPVNSYGVTGGQENSFAGIGGQHDSYLGPEAQSNFIGTGQDSFSSEYGPERSHSEDLSFNTGADHGTGFDSGENSYVGTASGAGKDFHLSDASFHNEHTPVTFSRQAGIQEFSQTNGQHSLGY